MQRLPQPRWRRQVDGRDVQTSYAPLLLASSEAFILGSEPRAPWFQCRRSRGAIITGGGLNGGYSVMGARNSDSADQSRRKLVGRGRALLRGSISWRPKRRAPPVPGE